LGPHQVREAGPVGAPAPGGGEQRGALAPTLDEYVALVRQPGVGAELTPIPVVGLAWLGDAHGPLVPLVDVGLVALQLGPSLGHGALGDLTAGIADELGRLSLGARP